MSNLFVTIKKRTIVLFLCAVICIGSAIAFFCVREAGMPAVKYTIVIDAGHGGIDGGAVGKKTGVTESEINLEYAETLKEICESFGMRVVMTRKDMNGLYNPLASNRKRSDMEKRKEIIDSSGADLVVSVHMNAFPRASSRGAQVFYGLDNERGKALATSVQNVLHKTTEHAKASPKEGDFYILNCTPLPGVLVEFGFLSNAEEERLLVSDDYRHEMCYAVATGILSFYEM